MLASAVMLSKQPADLFSRVPAPLYNPPFHFRTHFDKSAGLAWQVGTYCPAAASCLMRAVGALFTKAVKVCIKTSVDHSNEASKGTWTALTIVNKWTQAHGDDAWKDSSRQQARHRTFGAGASEMGMSAVWLKVQTTSRSFSSVDTCASHVAAQ